MRTVHRRSRLAAAIAVLIAAGLFTQRAEAQVSVGGVGYAQFQYQTSDTTITTATGSQTSHTNNFDITRAYINVNGRFAGGVVTRVTADVFGSGAAGGLHAFRLKYAYVAWTPDSSPLTFKIGAIHTPWLDWEEGLWDYRMQGQMAMERAGFLSSSDFGVGVDGKWAADRFNFQAGLYNGENYSTTALGDQRKDFMARASLRVLDTDDGSRVGGLRISAYGQVGAPNSGGQRQRFIGMVSYRTMNLTLAGEIGMATDSTTGATAANTVAKKKGRVISAYGVFHFPQTRVSLLGRVDMTTPNTDADTTKTTRIIAGAAYQVTPNLRVLADVDLLSFDSAFTPSPGQYATKSNAYFHAMFTF